MPTPPGTVGSITCCDENKRDIERLGEQVTALDRQVEENEREIDSFEKELLDDQRRMSELETLIKAQFAELARLEANYKKLLEKLQSLNDQIGQLGSEETQVGAGEILEELLAEIKDNGLKIGGWKLVQERDCDHLLLKDLVRGGWYKFAKTYEAHIVQGIKDPGPSNGKKMNPLAILGIKPCGKVQGVQKTYITSLY